MVFGIFLSNSRASKLTLPSTNFSPIYVLRVEQNIQEGPTFHPQSQVRCYVLKLFNKLICLFNFHTTNPALLLYSC